MCRLFAAGCFQYRCSSRNSGMASFEGVTRRSTKGVSRQRVHGSNCQRTKRTKHEQCVFLCLMTTLVADSYDLSTNANRFGEGVVSVHRVLVTSPSDSVHCSRLIERQIAPSPSLEAAVNFFSRPWYPSRRRSRTRNRGYDLHPTFYSR